MSPHVRLVAIEEGVALLRSGYVYLDVRSEAEFAESRAQGAVNVPWKRTSSSGMAPNERFLADVDARFARDAKLLVACKTHSRASAAAEVLVGAGFEHVVVLRPGFDGLRDHFGRVTDPGWGRLGLPVESDWPAARA